MLKPAALLLAVGLMVPMPLLAVEPPAQEEAATSAPIDAARFLIGRWVGEGMGGEVEEVWSPPMGGQMVGHLIYAREGKPVFYEIMLIREAPDAETPGALEFLVRHVNADFTAWEDKDEWLTFKAGSTGPGDLLTFKGLKIGVENDVMTAVLKMRDKEGVPKDVPFVLKRVK